MFARFVVTLLALSTARAQYPVDNCSNVMIGTRTKNPRPQPDVIMTPNTRYWKVHITPDIERSICAPYNLVGLEVWACDYDYAPSITAKSYWEVDVSRRGDLKQPGVIKSTVYCDGPLPGQGGVKYVQGPVVRAVPAQNVVG